MNAETIARRRLRFSTALGSALSPSSRAANQYHKWYYATGVWKRTTWMGVPVMKSVSDMWNYQEILHSLRPSLLLEFGTYNGGSAMFFASILRQLGKPFRVLSVDIDHSNVSMQSGRTAPSNF
jgi:cephalosporin hydroxylase